MPEFDPLMYDISRPDYEPSSTYADLREFLGGKAYKTVFNEYHNSWLSFEWQRARGPEVRLGQLFMNVLPEAEHNKLVGTLLDPFHKDDWVDICKALDYLILTS